MTAPSLDRTKLGLYTLGIQSSPGADAFPPCHNRAMSAPSRGICRPSARADNAAVRAYTAAIQAGSSPAPYRHEQETTMDERTREPRKITAEDINPRYNWGRHLPVLGTMGVDFEERVDYRRMHRYRLRRGAAPPPAPPPRAPPPFGGNNTPFLTPPPTAR